MKLSLRITDRGKLIQPFRIFEKIGIAIVNPRGVAKADKTKIVGM